VLLPVKEDKKVFYFSFFSLRCSSFHSQTLGSLVDITHSIVEKPPKKLRANIVDLTDTDKQVY
jgi:hypothetical protein